MALVAQFLQFREVVELLVEIFNMCVSHASYEYSLIDDGCRES